MFSIIVSVTLLGAAVLFFVLGKVFDAEGWLVVSGFTFFVYFIISVTFICVNLDNASIQHKAFEEIKCLTKQAKIHKTKCDLILTAVKAQLVEKFPAHEKEIFSAISPEGITTYLASYPEISSNTTFLSYTTMLSEKWDEYYKIQLGIEEKLADCNFRKVNPWLVSALIPSIPNEILEMGVK